MAENIVTVFNATEIADRVKILGAEISQAYTGHELTLLAVLEDSFVFVADLLRSITIPLQTNFLRFSHLSHGGLQDLSFTTQMDLSRRDVLLISGVLDTGVTQEYLIKQLETRGAKSVKLCVLLDKPGNRHVNVAPDWRVFETNEAFVFGYGLAFQERWRELPYLATLAHKEAGVG